MIMPAALKQVTQSKRGKLYCEPSNEIETIDDYDNEEEDPTDEQFADEMDLLL